jgi:hypothetical protein
MRHGILVAVVACGLVGVVLAPACDQLGLGAGGAGGYGGGVALCGGAGGYGGSGGGGYGGAGGAVCEIISQGACYDLCQAEYDAAALQCGSIANDADRKTCQDDAYETYKACRGACDKDPVEECKKLCDKQNLRCIARCPKGDVPCMAKCNKVYGKCLRDCE